MEAVSYMQLPITILRLLAKPRFLDVEGSLLEQVLLFEHIKQTRSVGFVLFCLFCSFLNLLLSKPRIHWMHHFTSIIMHRSWDSKGSVHWAKYSKENASIFGATLSQINRKKTHIKMEKKGDTIFGP